MKRGDKVRWRDWGEGPVITSRVVRVRDGRIDVRGGCNGGLETTILDWWVVSPVLTKNTPAPRFMDGGTPMAPTQPKRRGPGRPKATEPKILVSIKMTVAEKAKFVSQSKSMGLELSPWARMMMHQGCK